MIVLKNCSPEFIRACFPDQSGNVITVDQIIFFMFDGKVLAVSSEPIEIILEAEGGERRWWFKNGTPAEHSHWNKGNRDGEFKWWHANGILAEHSHFVGGKRDGESRQWFEDGTLREHSHFVKGVKIENETELLNSIRISSEENELQAARAHVETALRCLKMKLTNIHISSEEDEMVNTTNVGQVKV